MRNSLIARDFNRNPFALIEDFENDLARIFGNFHSMTGNTEMTPAMDLVEKDEHYVLSVDLPGVRKEDIHVEVVDNVLRVSGERKSEVEEEGYHEKRYGKFERAIKLNHDTKWEDIEAHYENGVLSLAIPKKGSQEAKKIEVKDGDKSNFWSKLLGKRTENETNKKLAS